MSEQQQNARLNEVLVRILRGLSQYAGECWPWCSVDHGDEFAAVSQIVADEQAEVQELVDLLTERGELVDFGTYPTEYTDLHYVSLDYLLDALVQEQVELIADLEQAVSDCADDPEGQELLKSLVPLAKKHLDTLSGLAAARAAKSST